MLLFEKKLIDMTAQEARLLTEQSDIKMKTSDNNVYHRILRAISTAAQNGEYDVFLDTNVGAGIIKKLEDDGYQVIESSWRNEYVLIIKW